MATLELQHLTKKFGDFTAVDDMNLSVAEGEMIALLGGSGCGKTTTLRMIAGFTEPFSGAILVDGKDVRKIPPYRRNVGIFFQNYALFPHMTLYDNVAYGLKLRKKSAQEIRDRVMSTLSTLKLEKAIKKLPSQLSGGMQQRAAIARSLVLDCDLLLLDEPFSALDAVVKVDLSEELKELQSELGITMMMVTHDQEEAFSLSDRIILMDHGHIVADAPPIDLYETQGNAFIQTFIIDQINKRARYIWNLKRGERR